MTGPPFVGRNVGETFTVVSAVTKIIGEDGKPYAVITHKALSYDTNPTQMESLLSGCAPISSRCQERYQRDVHGNPGFKLSVWGNIDSILLRWDELLL
jgi:hypothetical protein